jgi:RimJ/RimL family protein N-acetyltransferase
LPQVYPQYINQCLKNSGTIETDIGDKMEIKLRALTKNDMTTTQRWHNQKDIRDNYLGHPFPVNMEQEAIWYDSILTSNFPTTVFGIELADNAELVGICVLRNINLIHRNAEFAIYIGSEQHRGHGIAKQATLDAMNFAFSDIGLHRVYLNVLANNPGAVKFYEKLGFSREGEKTESVFKNGQFINEIVFGILKRNFKPIVV